MESILIQIPPQQRGTSARHLCYPLSDLNERQRETLEWLPRDRKGHTPVLRGPSKTAKAPGCLVELEQGEPIPADFTFKVPAQAIDADVPGLLDLWRKELDARRAHILERERKRSARAASPQKSRKPRKRSEPELPASEAGDTESTSAAQQPEPAALELAEVYRVLPLLGNLEFEPVAGPDSLELEARVWSSLVQIERFDAEGVDLSRIDEVLHRVHGPDWRDPDLVEDLDTRIAQATDDANAAHAELLAWIEQAQPKPKPEKAVVGEMQKQPRRKKVEVPLVTGMGPLMDLARQMIVDLCTAIHASRQILEQPEAYPDWAELYANAVKNMEASITDGLQAVNLAARLSLFEAWAESMAGIDANAQMSLWTEDVHRRLQRAVEPQVRRAHLWRKAWASAPVESAAAVAVLGLTS